MNSLIMDKLLNGVVDDILNHSLGAMVPYFTSNCLRRRFIPMRLMESVRGIWWGCRNRGHRGW